MSLVQIRMITPSKDDYDTSSQSHILCSGRNKRFFSDRTFLRSKKNFFAKQKRASVGAPQAFFLVILRGGSLDWLKQACEYFYFTARPFSISRFVRRNK